jgi:hypothetical protein
MNYLFPWRTARKEKERGSCRRRKDTRKRKKTRIAHMNTFLRSIKKVGRVFGADQIAVAFHAVSNPTGTTKRKFMHRSHVRFCVVILQETESQTKINKLKLGAPLVHYNLDGGKMTVRGFLYFDFSFVGPENNVLYLPGYARVREYGDPEMKGNTTYVYCWRKDLAKLVQ